MEEVSQYLEGCGIYEYMGKIIGVKEMVWIAYHWSQILFGIGILFSVTVLVLMLPIIPYLGPIVLVFQRMTVILYRTHRWP